MAWLGIDLVLVIIFSILGRAAHGEALDLSGIVRTAAPFVAGCLVAWIVILRSRQQGTTRKDGLVVLIATVVIGNIFRVLIGDTTHWSFILVTVAVLTVFLMGWRLLYGKFGPKQPEPRVPRKHRRKMEKAAEEG